MKITPNKIMGLEIAKLNKLSEYKICLPEFTNTCNSQIKSFSAPLIKTNFQEKQDKVQWIPGYTF